MLEHLAPYAARGFLCEFIEVPATGPLTTAQADIKHADSAARELAEVSACVYLDAVHGRVDALRGLVGELWRVHREGGGIHACREGAPRGE